jgi:hypothetical protein
MQMLGSYSVGMRLSGVSERSVITPSNAVIVKPSVGLSLEISSAVRR